MRYWKLIYYTAEGEYETKSFLITDEQHSQIRKAMDEKAEFIGVDGKPTIKRTLIASIIEADKEMLEYQRQGIKVDGLLEPAEQPKLTGKVISGLEKAELYLKRTKSDTYRKMGWEE